MIPPNKSFIKFLSKKLSGTKIPNVFEYIFSIRNLHQNRNHAHEYSLDLQEQNYTVINRKKEDDIKAIVKFILCCYNANVPKQIALQENY